MPRPYIPWNQSPASLAGAWIAGIHGCGCLYFGLLYLLAEDVHPVYGTAKGPDRLAVFVIYVVFAFALLSSGLIVSLFAPGWRRKLLLLGANLLPVAWIIVPIGWVLFFL